MDPQHRWAIARASLAVLGAWLVIMPAATVTLALRINPDDLQATTYSLALAGGWLAVMVLSIAVGARADRLTVGSGPWRALLLAAALAAIALSVLADLSDSLATTAVLWVVLQAVAGSLLGAGFSASARVARASGRGVVSGIVGAASLLALIAGAPIAAASTPWSFTAVALCGAALVAPLALARAPSAATPAAATDTGPVAVPARAGTAWPLLLLAGAVISAATALTNGYVVTIVRAVLERAGEGADVRAVATAAIVAASFAAVLSSLVAGPLLRSGSMVARSWIVGTSVMTIALLGVLIAPGLGVLIAAVALFGLGFGVVNGGEVTLTLATRSREAGGRSLAIYTTATTIPFVAVPGMVAGVGWGDRWAALVIAAAVCCVLGILLAATLSSMLRGR